MSVSTNTSSEPGSAYLRDQSLSPANIRSISLNEWLVAAGVALAMTVVLALPYILGYLTSGPGIEFTGLIMNPEDSNSYFAKMLQGYEGHWLYTIPFTSEAHDAAFLGGFYLLLGHIARILGVGLDPAWHLSRALASMFLFLVTFAFIAEFLPKRNMRWTAYLIALLGSGLGWLLFIAGQPYWLGAFPVDFKMPEAHLFFTALAFPHVAVGTALLMISFLFSYLALEDGKKIWLYALIAGLSNLAIGIVYPFLIYLVALAVGITWIYWVISHRTISWRQIGILLVTFVPALPLYIYYAYIHQTNEIFRSWSDQAATISPPFPHYLVAFGPLLILALLPLIKRRPPVISKSSLFLWFWILAAALLVYAPINPQRRFIQGLHVPLSILATVGLYQVVVPWLRDTKLFRKLTTLPRYSEQGLERLVVVAVIAFLSISNVYVLASVSATTTFSQPYPFFRETSEIGAVNWLRENTNREDVVFSAYHTGNYIASHSGNLVWIGHWAETVKWQEKSQIVEKFYADDAADDWRQQLLESANVHYVWHGDQERQLGGFEPSQAPYLRPIYEDGDVTIYLVNKS